LYKALPLNVLFLPILFGQAKRIGPRRVLAVKYGIFSVIGACIAPQALFLLLVQKK
jgi:hypothetical protein